jgi:hypothetical protein
MAEAIKVPDLKAEFPTFGRMARFSPGMYSIHWDNLKNIPLKLNGEPSTLDAVYVKFVNSKIKDEPDEHSGLRHKRYVTDQGDLDIEAEWTVLSTINTLAGLFKGGINPINVVWFYFDHDWSRDADECYVFFAVHDEKIVLESCHFMSSEPLILTQDKDDDPIWHSHPYFDEAQTRYWYRKFYSETKNGSLMVLRPDEPTLYYYDRATAKDSVRDLQLVTLVKMYRLLWIAVVLLAGIILPGIREYMFILAGVLLFDLFWRIWATRKVGQG